MAELKAGDKAPAFKAKDQHGNTVSLSDFKGKKLALYFYPEDDTELCTKQACNFRDHYKELAQHGIAVLGVSPDTADSHVSFTDKFKLNFPLLVDPDKKISGLYGTWGEKNMYGNIVIGMKRYTFLINEDGVIHHIIKKPKIGNDAAQIIAKFGL
jgi:peroxiredoxin Q/BCP